jgi:hypothetical protein
MQRLQCGWLAAIGMAVVVLCLVYFITLVIGPARFSGLTSGNATARFHQSHLRHGGSMAARNWGPPVNSRGSPAVRQC